MKHYKSKNNIRESMSELSKYRVKLGQEEYKLQCACGHTHTKDNMPSITSTGMGPNGKEYKCSLCQKPIDIRTVNPDDFKRAIQVVDTVCDQLKIQSNSMSTNDRKLLEKICQVQYGLYNLNKIYDASSQAIKNRQKAKETKRNNRRSNVSFS